jgi:hypothetical protein
MEGKTNLALTFAFYQGDQLVRRETVADLLATDIG